MAVAARDLAPTPLPAGVDDELLRVVRRFWERRLPGRGWARVLLVGDDGRLAELLSERGYTVTPEGLVDAVVCVETDDVGALRTRLRRRGLLIGHTDTALRGFCAVELGPGVRVLERRSRLRRGTT